MEDLEQGLVAAAEPAVLDHHGVGVDVEVGGHPVVALVRVGERAEGVEVLAAEDVDQEAVGLVEVGHGEADVVEASQPGQAHAHPFWIRND